MKYCVKTTYKNPIIKKENVYDVMWRMDYKFTSIT